MKREIKYTKRISIRMDKNLSYIITAESIMCQESMSYVIRSLIEEGLRSRNDKLL
jgi:hypothetical protein